MDGVKNIVYIVKVRVFVPPLKPESGL